MSTTPDPYDGYVDIPTAAKLERRSIDTIKRRIRIGYYDDVFTDGKAPWLKLSSLGPRPMRTPKRRGSQK